MNRFRPGRFIGITVGALAILLIGVYGPATLLGPLPAATATRVTPAIDDASPFPPVLPTQGGSAVVALDTAAPGATIPDASAIAGTAPIAVGGSADALPMASAAKIVTALVVLDA